MGKQPSVEVRLLETPEECRLFQLVQQWVWNGSELDTLPIHVLMAQIRNGGIVMGAYVPDGPPASGGLVGIVQGWPALIQTASGAQASVHYSHTLAVLTTWRRVGIGYWLKLAQREAVLNQGNTELITWTFDPLYYTNAVFNLHRLGATGVGYIRDAYGNRDDKLNTGVPTDRCQVQWHLRSVRVVEALAGQDQTKIWSSNALQRLPTRCLWGLLVPGSALPAFDGSNVAVPVPNHLDVLHQRAQGLLMAWRLYLRTTLEEAFLAGYQIVDCVPLDQQGWHYILAPSEKSANNDSVV